tara:strand:+ start:650 stop:1114 length:465 start_codon:yes stop_codon:yes gene_type:complete
MKNSINVVLGYSLWKKKIKNPKNYLSNNLLKLNKLRIIKNKYRKHTVFLTNNKTMKILNKKFRNKNKPTDVLSFPFYNKINKKNLYLGDIAISYEIINKRSKKTNFIKEFQKIWIHGYLHLLGYDHQKEKDFIKMKKLEDLIFKYLNKKNDCRC